LPLPAGLPNAWAPTTSTHSRHADTGQPDLPEVAAWTTIVGVAVTYTCSRCVTWLTVQLELCVQAILVRGVRVLDNSLELSATLRVAGDDFLALLVLGDL